MKSGNFKITSLKISRKEVEDLVKKEALKQTGFDSNRTMVIIQVQKDGCLITLMEEQT